MALIPLRQAMAQSGQSGLIPLRQALTSSRTPQAPSPAAPPVARQQPTTLDVRPMEATPVSRAGNVLSLAGTANSLVGGPTDLSGVLATGAGAARLAGDIADPNMNPAERALRAGQDVTGVVGGLANISGVQSLVPGISDAARASRLPGGLWIAAGR